MRTRLFHSVVLVGAGMLSQGCTSPPQPAAGPGPAVPVHAPDAGRAADTAVRKAPDSTRRVDASLPARVRVPVDHQRYAPPPPARIEPAPPPPWMGPHRPSRP